MSENYQGNECKGLDEDKRCRLAIIYLSASHYDWPCQLEKCKFYSQLNHKGEKK